MITLSELLQAGDGLFEKHLLEVQPDWEASTLETPEDALADEEAVEIPDEEGDIEVYNSSPAPSVARPSDESRKLLAKAMHEDFEGIRTELEALEAMEPGTPEFVAAAAEIAPKLEALMSAAPGSLAADKAWEEILSGGLLEGWGLNAET